jgi:transposase-like protein
MSDIRCPEGHTKVWKKGEVPSRTGPKQRYVCFTCGRTFYKPKPVAKKPKSGKKKSG